MATYQYVPTSEDVKDDVRSEPSERPPSWYQRKIKSPGFWATWRGTAIIGVSIAALTSLVNILVLVWAYVKLPQRDGFAVAFTGSLSQVKTIDFVAKLFINILSTSVLISSCRCTQLIASPTRHDVNKAHERHDYMDIGLRTWHNLKTTRGWRLFVIWILFLTSTPLHLIYNSATVVESVAQDFVALTVDKSFASGATWNAKLSPYGNSTFTTLVQQLQHDATVGLLSRVEPDDCNQLYDSQFQSTSGNLLVVSNEVNQTREAQTVSATVAYIKNVTASSPGKAYSPYEWTADLWLTEALSGPDTYNGYYADALLCEVESTVSCATNNSRVAVTVDHCLVQELPQRNMFLINPGCLIIVIAMTLIKAIVLLIFMNKRFTPLVMIGDAISSFLAHPDSYTAGMGALSVTQTVQSGSNEPLLQQSSAFSGKHYRWFHAPARFRWFIGTVSSLIPALVGTACLVWALEYPSYESVTDSRFVLMGGESPLIIVARSYVLTALTVNAVQLLMSIGYIVVSDLVTAIYVAHEYQNFAIKYQKLRTTNGLGGQSTRFALSLPNRYALPLVISWMVMHWLVAADVILVRASVYDFQAILSSARSYTAMNISAGYTLPVMIMPVTLLVIIILFGIRKLAYGIPLARTSSLAISAACHRGPHEDPHMVLMPIKYGILPGVLEDGTKCIGFSCLPVETLVEGERYTSYVPKQCKSVEYGTDV